MIINITFYYFKKNGSFLVRRRFRKKCHRLRIQRPIRPPRLLPPNRPKQAKSPGTAAEGRSRLPTQNSSECGTEIEAEGQEGEGCGLINQCVLFNKRQDNKSFIYKLMNYLLNQFLMSA